MRNVLKKTAIVLAWLVLWQCLALVVNNKIYFVGPIEVAKEIALNAGKAIFWKTIGMSLLRIIGGFLIAFALGYLLSLIAYKCKFVQEFLAPFVTFLKSVPVASVVVVLLIWFGSEYLSLYVTFMVVFPCIYTNMLEGLHNTDEDLLEMGRVHRISKLFVYKYFYKPAFYPYLMSASKVSVGMCFKSGVAAEIIGLPSFSIGERIYMDKIYLNTAGVFAWSAVIIFISFAIEKLVIALLKRGYQDSLTVPITSARKLDVILAKRTEEKVKDVVISGVSKSYEENVLDNFSYNFKAGESYCIMGESGIGKTTLLRIITGLTDYEGEEITNVRSSYDFQENRLLEELSGLGNILITKPLYTINEIIWYVGKLIPEEKMLYQVAEYSGGMKRRVALLRALLCDSQLLILDEPFTGLDDENKYKCIELIKELKGDRTLIITSHNEADAEMLNAEVIRIS